MSADRDVDRIVRSWLDEGVTRLPDRLLDAVLDQVPATPQRRSLWPARRFPVMNNPALRLGFAAAALVVAVGLGASLMSGPQVGGVASPSPSPSASPSASPSPSPSASSDETARVLRPGPHALDPRFPVSITFDIPPTTAPAQWLVCAPNEVEQGVCYESAKDVSGPVVSFLIVTNVVADPCGEALLDPPVGPSVDDLVTAISNLKDFSASTPRDITVDGYRGKEFTVTAPAGSACELRTWATADRTNGVGLGERNVIQILDVDGVRVLISGAYDPDLTTADADLAAIRQVISSVHIEP
jgi:hypothetical protein